MCIQYILSRITEVIPKDLLLISESFFRDKRNEKSMIKHRNSQSYHNKKWRSSNPPFLSLSPAIKNEIILRAIKKMFPIGIFCGGYHYSLKMYTYERVRARNFARTWGFVQCSQAIPIAIGVPISGNKKKSNVVTYVLTTIDILRVIYN